ncbi:HNH endonuclease [Fictibacillus sp. Mic-4]|uniref:HNH endonuclease n=1 Tax=Fictibacillus sp. Mic-4 TaxID=3132826 RepID=UPI003CEEBF42
MAEIPLTKGFVAIVDECDYEYLSNFPWHYSKGYAINRSSFFHEDGKRKTVLMHRLILQVDPRHEVDHINGNSLDNRRNNLRIANRAENSRNIKTPSHNTSGYKGVTKSKKGWRASIHLNSEKIHIGVFKTKEDAAKAYNIKALELFGDFARLNDVNHEEFSIPEKKPLSSKYKGVSKKGKRWQAGIYQYGKRIHIGNFATEMEAARAYNRKALELFGESAKINKIVGE